jgi:hypothetical protein
MFKIVVCFCIFFSSSTLANDITNKDYFFRSDSDDSDDILFNYGDYAKLSEDIYDSYDKKTTSVDGFTLLEGHNDTNTGLVAGIYKNNHNGEIVVAFGGTTAGGGNVDVFKDILGVNLPISKDVDMDIKTDIELLKYDTIPNQMIFVSAYVQRAEEYAKESNSNIAIAGHSLGGALAQDASVKTGYRAITFNSAPFPINNAKNTHHNAKITNIRAVNDPLTIAMYIAKDIDEGNLTHSKLSSYVQLLFLKSAVKPNRETIDNVVNIIINKQQNILKFIREKFHIPQNISISNILQGKQVIVDKFTGHSIVGLVDIVESIETTKVRSNIHKKYAKNLYSQSELLAYLRDQLRNSTQKKQQIYTLFITEVLAVKDSNITQEPNLLLMNGQETITITSADTDIKKNSEKIIKKGYDDNLPTWTKNDPNIIAQINVKFQKTQCLEYTCWGKWSEDVVYQSTALDPNKEINIKSGWVMGQVDPNVRQYLEQAGTLSYTGDIVGSGGILTTNKTNNTTGGKYTGDITGTFNLQANASGNLNNQMTGNIDMTNGSTENKTKAIIENVNIHSNGTFTGGVRITDINGSSVSHNGTGNIQGVFAGSQAQEVYGNIETRRHVIDNMNSKVSEIIIGTFAGTKQ